MAQAVDPAVTERRERVGGELVRFGREHGEERLTVARSTSSIRATITTSTECPARNTVIFRRSSGAK